MNNNNNRKKKTGKISTIKSWVTWVKVLVFIILFHWEEDCLHILVLVFKIKVPSLGIWKVSFCYSLSKIYLSSLPYKNLKMLPTAIFFSANQNHVIRCVWQRIKMTCDLFIQRPQEAVVEEQCWEVFLFHKAVI